MVEAVRPSAVPAWRYDSVRAVGLLPRVLRYRPDTEEAEDEGAEHPV